MAEVLIDRRYMQRVPRLIEGAQACVRVAMFQLQVKGKSARRTSRELAVKLAAKGLEGKEVRVLLNVAPGKARVAAINRDAAKWLKERKVQVRHFGPRRICHAKIVIVDEDVAIIGSHNWGVGSFTGNFEVSVVVRDAGQVRKLAEHFDALWAVSKEMRG
jgi:cardiolipin synthase